MNRRKMKKSELAFLSAAMERWFKLPEAQGFSKVKAARIVDPWAQGPRIKAELDEIYDGIFLELLFYFRKKQIGYQVVGVWTVHPRAKIWPAEESSEARSTSPKSEVSAP